MRLIQMLKRDLHLFIRGLVPAVLLTLLLIVACALAGISAYKGSDRSSAPVKVALVDKEDSVLSRISITMVTGQDYVSSLMNLEVVDEPSAMKGLSSGKFSAAVILPDNYMECIMQGKNCAGKIYISDAVKSEGEVIRAIADFGERLLTAGQYGVFAGEQIAYNSGAETYNSFIENSNTGLINFVIDAYNSVFTFEVLNYSDTGVSLEYYYAACWLTLLFFVCGLFFPDLYTADCRGSIYARLRTARIGSMDFLAGKLLYPALFRLLISMPLLIITGVKALPYLIIAAVSVSIITGCISVAMSRRGGWTVMILGLSSAFLFMAGGMIPRTMLPEILPKISSFTPFGAIQSMFICALGGNFEIKSAILICIYVIAALWICLHFLDNPDIHNEEVRL